MLMRKIIFNLIDLNNFIYSLFFDRCLNSLPRKIEYVSENSIYHTLNSYRMICKKGFKAITDQEKK
jgi:hypothetical protein